MLAYPRVDCSARDFAALEAAAKASKSFISSMHRPIDTLTLMVHREEASPHMRYQPAGAALVLAAVKEYAGSRLPLPASLLLPVAGLRHPDVDCPSLELVTAAASISAEFLSEAAWARGRRVVAIVLARR